MKNIIFCGAFLCCAIAIAQTPDSLRTLDEIILIGPKKELSLKQPKPLAPIDDYLQQSTLVSMVRRGAYALEPTINNMATERTQITIEGMHIFGACTDKMDPITSYVEVSNLAEATISSGQHGSGFGPTIGGAIDLVRNRSGFLDPGWKAAVNTGFETTNSQKIIGTALNYTSKSFFVDTDAMYRDADNYRAGNRREIPFSQFTKLNLSTTAGWLVAKNALLEASAIYDKATDVGYPALPMDVSLAEAFITSMRYELKPENALLSIWDSKLYFNSVTHIMDDSNRDVAIRMDMPGKTKTFGGYSSVKSNFKKHAVKANLNAFYAIADAEMTMYPENPEEAPMFMLTWANVHTLFTGIFVEDHYEFNCHSAVRISSGVGHHSNTVGSDFGLESMKIFYPNMDRTKNRLLKNIAATYSFKKRFEYTIGVGYGERAPSVSEGYGFYLFNSFDNYDYIGNPEMNNEKSIEANGSIGYQTKKVSARVSGAYFKISDYIIGLHDPSMLPMTIGANGVRVYTALPYATILNANAELEYKISSRLLIKTRVGYAKGSDSDGCNLPSISPFHYAGSLSYKKQSLSAEFQLHGNAAQQNFAADFGEDRTPAYAIVDCNLGYSFTVDRYKLHTKIGVENITDAYYSTFGDWNNVARPGRNFYVNVIFQN